jgi:hypothetical protein
MQLLINLMTAQLKENPMSKLKHSALRIQQERMQARVFTRTAAKAMILLIALTWTARAHVASPPVRSNSVALLSMGLATPAAGELFITINDAGMTPTSATVSGGIVHLRIENNSGREAITLRISRESGGLVREVSMPEHTRELNTEVEIGAGRYVLTEASTPAWACQLTVQ